MKLAVFAQQWTSYDDHMINGLARAFRQLGHEALAIPILPPPEYMPDICKRYDLDVVIEINRTKEMLPPIPAKHIAWIQDYRPDIAAKPVRSDILYCLCRPELLTYYVPGEWKQLLTGVSDQYLKKEFNGYESDFSMIGYLPKPLSDYQLNRTMYVNPCFKPPTLREAIAWLEKEMARNRADRAPMPNMRSMLSKYLSDIGQGSQVHDGMIWQFDKIPARIIERKQLVEKALEFSKSLRLYGHDTWKQWPQFAQYYQSYLTEQADMADVYSSTKLNLHTNPNGFNMHARVLDCMGAGGVIMVHASPDDKLPGGIEDYFTPFSDYIPFTLDNFKETVDDFIHDDEYTSSMGHMAKALINNDHTWKHRAEQILKDLK